MYLYVTSRGYFLGLRYRFVEVNERSWEFRERADGRPTRRRGRADRRRFDFDPRQVCRLNGLKVHAEYGRQHSLDDRGVGHD